MSVVDNDAKIAALVRQIADLIASEKAVSQPRFIPIGRGDTAVDTERQFPPYLTNAGIVPILLSIPDAGACLGVSTSALYKMIREHKLPAGSIVFIGGRMRILYDALKAFYLSQAI